MCAVSIDDGVPPATGPAAGSATGPVYGFAGGGGGDPLLAALRRLMRLADGGGDPEGVYGALAAELCGLVGAEEVQVHHLRPEGGHEQGEPVVAYLYGGEGRLTYVAPREERAPGIEWVASTGQSVQAVGARELSASLPRLASVAGVGCALLLALTVGGEVEAVAVAGRRLPEAWPEHEVQRAAVLVDQAAGALALLRARAEAGTDAVTGCMNHRAMRRRLREEIDRATRTGGKLACLLIDLDDFKLVNDRHGHPAGDAVLRGVARALMGEFRAFDRVARYGGDEFVVILPAADLQSAALAGDRALRRLGEVHSFDLVAGVAASIGVAQWQAPMSAEQLLAACDAALLRSKRTGKGHVELARNGGAPAGR
jgi:diguanylate cyclase (GGDEF)-like protein